jgi:thioredoxin-like negative regulator of GroEL
MNAVTTTAGLLDRAFALFEAGRYPEAADYFRAALVLDPEEEDAQIGLGCCLGELGRHAEAAVVFGIAAATARSDGAWPTLLAADALARCGEGTMARGALAWFAEIARSGAVADEHKNMAAQISARLGRDA